jgi:hypothetical protein
MTDIDTQVAMIAILNDMTENEVLELPIKEYSKLAAQTAFLSEKPQVKKRVPNKIKMGDNEYVLIKEIQDMTAGQYIDYQQYLSMGEKYLPYILSCFLILKGKKYGDMDVELVVNDIKDYLTVEEALSISNFFMKKFQTSTRATLLYLEWKMKKMKKKMKDETEKEKMMEAIERLHLLRSLMKNGDGLVA